MAEDWFASSSYAPNFSLLQRIADMEGQFAKRAFVPAGGAPGGDPNAAGGGAPAPGGDPAAAAAAPPAPDPAAGGGMPGMDPAMMQQMMQQQMMQGGKGGGKKVEQMLLDAKINQILRMQIQIAQKLGVTLDPSMLTPPQGDPMVDQQAQQEMTSGNASLPSLGGGDGAQQAGQQPAAGGPPPMPTVAKAASYHDEAEVASVGVTTLVDDYTDQPASESIQSLILGAMKLR